LDRQSLSPSNQPRRAKNLLSPEKKPINNDVIDRRSGRRRLTTGLPFRHQSQPGAGDGCYLNRGNIEDTNTVCERLTRATRVPSIRPNFAL
jgi:hypothetical protein